MKHVITIILIVAALMTAAGLLLRHRDPAKAYTNDRKAWQAFQDGERMMQAFRFAEAGAHLQQAVALDPDLAPAHAALAELYRNQGHPDHSLKHLALADSLAAALGDRRGRVLLQLRLAAAENSRFYAHRDSLLKLARSLAPREIEVLHQEAIQASQDQEMDRAEAAWRDILAINPNYATAYNQLGYLYLAQGRYDEAETAIRRYGFVAPDLANPHDSLGDVLMTRGRYEEAEIEYGRALAKQEDFFYPHMNLVYLYLARGQVGKALDRSEELLQQFAGTALETQFERQVINHLFQHRLVEPLAIYAQRYLAREKDSPGRTFVQIQLLLSRQEPVSALAQIDSLHAAYEAKPWHRRGSLEDRDLQFGLLRCRALAAEQLGLHEAAADLLREALLVGRQFAPHVCNLARVHLAFNLVPLGRYDEARVLIREALAINPRLAAAILVAAGIEVAAEREEEALRLLDALQGALALADADFPALLEAQRLRQSLGDPDHI